MKLQVHFYLLMQTLLVLSLRRIQFVLTVHPNLFLFCSSYVYPNDAEDLLVLDFLSQHREYTMQYWFILYISTCQAKLNIALTVFLRFCAFSLPVLLLTPARNAFALSLSFVGLSSFNNVSLSLLNSLSILSLFV